jgi:hypothetical protein
MTTQIHQVAEPRIVALEATEVATADITIVIRDITIAISANLAKTLLFLGTTSIGS